MTCSFWAGNFLDGADASFYRPLLSSSWGGQPRLSTVCVRAFGFPLSGGDSGQLSAPTPQFFR